MIGQDCLERSLSTDVAVATAPVLNLTAASVESDCSSPYCSELQSIDSIGPSATKPRATGSLFHFAGLLLD